MAVLQRNKPKADRRIDHAEIPPPAAGPEVEAPDRGEWNPEPPEDVVVRAAEAPDAGDGRMSFLEQEFTRGRSQS